MATRLVAASFVLGALLVVLFASQSLLAGPATEVTPSPAPIFPSAATSDRGPQFEGELLGIYIASAEAILDKGYIVDSAELCPAGYDVLQEHESIPDVPAFLPEGAIQPASYPALKDELTPAALVCRASGEPHGSWRYFELKDDGTAYFTPSILLHRVFLERPYFASVAPVDWVDVRSLGGEQVIVVGSPVSHAASPTDVTQILIPEQGGFLRIQAKGVDLSQALGVAEAIITGEKPVVASPAPMPAAPPDVTPTPVRDESTPQLESATAPTPPPATMNASPVG